MEFLWSSNPVTARARLPGAFVPWRRWACRIIHAGSLALVCLNAMGQGRLSIERRDGEWWIAANRPAPVGVRISHHLLSLAIGEISWPEFQEDGTLRFRLPPHLETAPQLFFVAAELGGAARLPDGYVWIPAGSFLNGSDLSEVGRDEDETPRTQVVHTEGFYMQRMEVTQREFQEMMGWNPSHFAARNGWEVDMERPVETVSWREAAEYCRRATEKARASGWVRTNQWIRLPTEAEWEYGCRGGTWTRYHHGSAIRTNHANFNWVYQQSEAGDFLVDPEHPSPGRPVGVGSFPANRFGLHDMHGNVWEWVEDWHFNRYSGGEVANPRGPETGQYKIMRGGGYDAIGWHCRSANRSIKQPDTRWPYTGFRTVISDRP